MNPDRDIAEEAVATYRSKRARKALTIAKRRRAQIKHQLHRRVPLAGFQGYYEVNRLGEIWGLERWVWAGKGHRGEKADPPNGVIVVHKPTLGYRRILATRMKTKPITPDGRENYVRVTLRGPIGRHTEKLHLLVVTTFHGPRPQGHQVYECDHKDRNRNNNRADNLRWISRKKNNARRMAPVKISDEQVMGLHEERASQEAGGWAFQTQVALAKYFNVHVNTVVAVLKLRRQGHLRGRIDAMRAEYGLSPLGKPPP